MAIDFNWPKFNRLVTGPSGSGKTTLALEQFRAEKAARKVVFDSQFEISGKMKTAPIRGPLVFAGACCRQAVTVFQPDDNWPTVADAFAWFFATVFELAQRLHGRTLVFCDELQDFVPQGPQSLVPRQFMDCLEKGRRRQLDLLCACQSASRVNLAIRAQLTELVTFCQVEKNALEFTRGYEIPDADVKGLGRYQWLMRNGQSGVITLGGPKQTSRVTATVVNQRGRGTRPLKNAPAKSP